MFPIKIKKLDEAKSPLFTGLAAKIPYSLNVQEKRAASGSANSSQGTREYSSRKKILNFLI